MKRNELLEKIMELQDKMHLIEVKKEEFSNELTPLHIYTVEDFNPHSG